MRKLHIKVRIIITILVGLVTGTAYLILISHRSAYDAYCAFLSFLPPFVIDFILPLIPSTLAGILLGNNGSERKTLIISGISMVVILVLFSLMYTIRFGGLTTNA